METTQSQLAANALLALGRTQEESDALAERARSAQAELDALSSQRLHLQGERDALAQLLEDARVDRERAAVAYDVSVGTAHEQDHRQALADRDDLVESLQADLLAMDPQQLEPSPREQALKDEVQACFAERERLFARRAHLEQLYTQAHEAHGREVYHAAKGVETHLAQQVTRAADLLQKRQRQLSEYRAGMAARFADWPTLAAEVGVAYKEAPDDAAARILRAVEAYLATLETELARLPFDLFHPELLVGSYRLWPLLGMEANDVRLMHFHLHHQTPPDRWPIVPLSARRQAIAAALAEHDLGHRHTTPSELARITAKLEELAQVGSA